MLRVNEQLDVHELAREESTVLIVKDGLEFQCAGGRVNDIIEGQQGAGCEFRTPCTVKRVDRQFFPFAQLLLNLGELIFGDAENYRDGLKLRDHDEGRGAIGLDDIPGIDEPQSNAPGNGRGDMGVDEIDLGIGKLALVVLHRAFILQHDLLLIVQLLLGDGVASEGLLVALQIDLGFVQDGLIMCQLSFDLRKRRLIRTGIDFD